MKVVHHKVYVDPQGRPVSPPASGRGSVRPCAHVGRTPPPAGSTVPLPRTPRPRLAAQHRSRRHRRRVRLRHLFTAPRPLPCHGSGRDDRANAGAGHGAGDAAADDGVHATSAAAPSGVHGIEVPLSEPGADGYWTERRARAMGSTAHIVLGDAPVGLDEWALEEIERLEQCWTRFRADSELANLHARAGQWVDVSTSMLLALTCARDVHLYTNGLFDPTILEALERAGYDRTFEDVIRGDAGAINGAPSPRPVMHGSRSTSTRPRARYRAACASISAASGRAWPPISSRSGWLIVARGARS